jgi:hypothetical protein
MYPVNSGFIHTLYGTRVISVFLLSPVTLKVPSLHNIAQPRLMTKQESTADYGPTLEN